MVRVYGHFFECWFVGEIDERGVSNNYYWHLFLSFAHEQYCCGAEGVCDVALGVFEGSAKDIGLVFIVVERFQSVEADRGADGAVAEWVDAAVGCDDCKFFELVFGF